VRGSSSLAGLRVRGAGRAAEPGQHPTTTGLRCSQRRRLPEKQWTRASYAHVAEPSGTSRLPFRPNELYVRPIDQRGTQGATFGEDIRQLAVACPLAGAARSRINQWSLAGGLGSHSSSWAKRKKLVRGPRSRTSDFKRNGRWGEVRSIHPGGNRVGQGWSSCLDANPVADSVSSFHVGETGRALVHSPRRCSVGSQRGFLLGRP